jgi:hypothetical protein
MIRWQVDFGFLELVMGGNRLGIAEVDFINPNSKRDRSRTDHSGPVIVGVETGQVLERALFVPGRCFSEYGDGLDEVIVGGVMKIPIASFSRRTARRGIVVREFRQVQR